MDSDPDFVNVAIRIKPVSNTEQHCLRVLSNEPPVRKQFKNLFFFFIIFFLGFITS